MRKSAIRHSAICAAVLLALAGMQVHAQVQDPPPASVQQRSFDVPAGTATTSIPEFARQAGVQIVAPGERLAEQRTPPVRGTMDRRAALAQLLSGTELQVASDDGRTITLTGDSTGVGNGGVSEPQETQGGGADNAQPPPSGPPPVDPAVSQPPLPAPRRERVAEVDAVIVTGTFLRRTDAETVLPVTTIGQTEIELSGVNTASELLSQLPQSAAFDNAETATGPNDARGDAASVNLRGLGSGNTLVLLNGRRIAPHPISAGAVPRLSSNINQIPLGAVQSIEVLRDGASALYGSDAVAGVINTRLKRDYQGFETSLRYGNVSDGGLDEISASALGGVTFNGGRSNWMGFASLYDRDSLSGAERGITADLRERAGSDAAAWNNTSVSSPWGRFTAGIANPDGSFTPHQTPGGAENGQFHTRPEDGGAGVAPGALPTALRYDFAPEYILIPETRRVQLFSSLSHDFSGTLSGFVDAFYYNADSHMSNATAPVSANSDNQIHVPASNYWNPYGTRFYGPGTANPDIAPSDVLIRNYRPLEIGPRTADVESTSYQVLTGLRGLLGSWDWEVGAAWGEGRTTDIGRNMISESRLRQQLALDTPDAFNVFGGPGVNPAHVLDAVRVDTWRRGESGLGLLDAKATGPLFELPGGEVLGAVGVEYRYEDFSDRRDELSNGDDIIAQSQSSDSDGSRNVKSAFLELSVPLFGENNAIPGLRRLELSLAGRTEHYSDFGSATKPKVGLAWSPVSWLMLRGSYNEGFRAPTLAQVFVGEIIRRNTGTPDPWRADVTGTAADLGVESRQVIRGGNPGLGPEEAKARNFGIVLDVPFVEGLSFTADYFHIRQSDVIDTFGESDQLALDFLLRSTGQGFNPDVVRLPVTAGDQAAFDDYNAANPGATRQATGAVDYILDTYINISSREVSGVDLGMRYRMPETRLGRFTLRADMARLNRFEQRRDDDAPTVSQIGVNGLPRTRGVASVHWRREAVNAGLQANYVSSFQDTSAPADANGSPYTVGSWTTWNAFFGYRFEASALDGTALRLGMNNLFDRAPPLADDDRGFDAGVHDPRGRFIYAEVRKRW
ncbi:TonB-dependent receptor [Luteimonas salinilitoris]|uniref:TonB-dependent receptor n=1 Tax=Luteimonas salinilitoris TaxID=3237697 RepID=A0ABV4HWK4_9GAMM